MPISNASRSQALASCAAFLAQTPNPGIITVAHTQSNAIVFPTGEATADELARVAANPARHGSWFYFPKAKDCRFEDGEMIVVTTEGHPLIAFRPLGPGESDEAASRAAIPDSLRSAFHDFPARFQAGFFMPGDNSMNWYTPCAYDDAQKRSFHSTGRKRLKALAAALDFKTGRYDCDQTAAGSLYSGEVTLHGE